MQTREARRAAPKAGREKLERERAAALEAVTDFGQREPMVNATVRELEHAGVNERPRTVLADAGHWHNNRGMSRLRRGRTAVRSEWRLIAATDNLLTLPNHWIQPVTG